MRRPLVFGLEGVTLAGSVDFAAGRTGLLIVTGGTQLRIGAHRGQATLAAQVADAGYPTFRFDRRGVGDSDGEDPGFRESGADIAAAAATFRAECPGVERIIGYGLCDGAAALALHHRSAGIDGLLLANPWLVEAATDMPPPAAIRRRYAQRLGSLAAWKRLLRGEINLTKAARGLRAAAAPANSSGLAGEVAAALAAGTVPVRFLLAKEDATAQAFAAEYRGRGFAGVRERRGVECLTLASGSHSFAGAAESQWLAARVIEALERFDRG
ncbi:MAG: alpha/beta hydrolase [Sphingomonas bacterium]|nr:alpha/beta hydrolase [Sphingomonas bacterium]